MLKRLEKGKLYRTKQIQVLLKTHCKNKDKIATIPAQSIVCFLGHHASNHWIIQVGYGELIGWLFLEKNSLDALFTKPREL